MTKGDGRKLRSSHRNILRLVRQEIPPPTSGGPRSRRRIKASARRLWIKLNPSTRRQIAEELRSDGYPGESDWSVFVRFTLSELPKFESDVRKPTRTAIGIEFDSQRAGDQLIEDLHHYILRACPKADSPSKPSRAALLDLVVPFWRGLTQQERETLAQELHSRDLIETCLVENLVEHARQLIQDRAKQPFEAPTAIIAAWSHVAARLTRNSISAPANVATTAESPTPLERGFTGNGRPAPYCRYCGSLTLLGGTYHHCAAVEKATEEWFCTNPRCVGVNNPTKFQYPVSDYARRG